MEMSHRIALASKGYVRSNIDRLVRQAGSSVEHQDARESEWPHLDMTVARNDAILVSR